MHSFIFLLFLLFFAFTSCFNAVSFIYLPMYKSLTGRSSHLKGWAFTVQYESKNTLRNVLCLEFIYQLFLTHSIPGDFLLLLFGKGILIALPSGWIKALGLQSFAAHGSFRQNRRSVSGQQGRRGEHWIGMQMHFLSWDGNTWRRGLW